MTAPAPVSSLAAAGVPRFDDLPDGVIVVDRSGRVEHTNSTFLVQVERLEREVLHQLLEDLVAEEDMLRLVGFPAMFDAGPVQDGHVIFSSSDGRRRPLIISAGLSRNERHVLITTRPAGVVQRELADASRWVVVEQERSTSLAEARDALFAKNEALRAAQDDLQRAYERLQTEVSTRERLERELGLARKLEAVGQLSAGVAHEINTPLQYVGDSVHFLGQAFQRLTGYVTRVEALTPEQPAVSWGELRAGLAAARKEARLDFVMDEIPRAVAASKEGIEHVSKIVQALKAFSHQGSEEKGASDINAAIQNTLVMAHHEYKNVATVVTELGELPPVLCVVSQLNQVFLNLIVNAAHALADAGRAGAGTITVKSRTVGELAEVSVTDDGCGIPDELRHKIFEQFFTTKAVGRGTGQGLALARQIVVDGHGGTLSFESSVGKGSTFTLRLPIDGVSPVV
jgi:signal transduction histidine kinase